MSIGGYFVSEEAENAATQKIIEMGGELRRPVVQLDQSDLDWQRLNEMLTNYDKARADKKQSAARLRDMGLDISE